MEDNICCLFEEKDAQKAMKEKEFELVEWIVNSYRDDRALYRCKKCGGLVLYEYEETAHFLPGEDWDNAYCEEYYWPVKPEDIQTCDGEMEFNWSAITARKHIAADYRELDVGEKLYRFVETKPSVTAMERTQFAKECAATVVFDSLPVGKGQFQDMCIFIQIPEYPNPRDLRILMPNHDDPQEIRVSYKGGTYSMELGFPMGDFGRTHPLMLERNGMSFDDVKLFLSEICLKQKSTEDIPELMEQFVDISSRVFPEES